MVEDNNDCLEAGDFVIPLVALGMAGVALKAAEPDLVDVLKAVVGVRGGIEFPNFCIDAAVGVGREGVSASSVSSREVDSDSGAISAATRGTSFLQFSKKELGASAICLCTAFVVKGTSGSVCDKVSAYFTWLLEATGVDGDGLDKGWPCEGRT